MPLEVDHLVNFLHEAGYLQLKKALEDRCSRQTIGKGAFGKFSVRTIILDLSEYGLSTLDKYLAENTKKDEEPFDCLLATLEDLHVFTDDDRRFKKGLREDYRSIYISYKHFHPTEG